MGAFFSFYMNDCSNSKVLDDVDLELYSIKKKYIHETTLDNKSETINITPNHPAIL